MKKLLSLSFFLKTLLVVLKMLFFILMVLFLLIFKFKFNKNILLSFFPEVLLFLIISIGLFALLLICKGSKFVVLFESLLLLVELIVKILLFSTIVVANLFGLVFSLILLDSSNFAFGALLYEISLASFDFDDFIYFFKVSKLGSILNKFFRIGFKSLLDIFTLSFSSLILIGLKSLVYTINFLLISFLEFIVLFLSSTSPSVLFLGFIFIGDSIVFNGIFKSLLTSNSSSQSISSMSSIFSILNPKSSGIFSF